MTTPIHSTWDAEKVTAHLADLRASADLEQAIADAFTEAADGHERDADRIRRQIRHCELLFAEPKKPPT